MVIRGNSRGNARQLGTYLAAQKDNDAVRIFDVDGLANPQAEDLYRAVFAMGISEELTKSQKGLYHAQINPAPGELMNDARWLQATDILAKQLGLENQRRVIVLHTKKERTHAHVVWERYDYSAGKMISDSFSRLAQDRARKEMEKEFNHSQTPHRNKHRPELKATLSDLWNRAENGAEFIKACREHNYLLATGSGRSPYVVVDENGRSYDLARQLKNVRLKDVRHRLRNETLLGEKDAIQAARNMNANPAEQGGDGKGKQKASVTQNHNTMDKDYSENKSDMTGNDGQKQQPRPENKREQFSGNTHDVTHPQNKKTLAEEFLENKADLTPEERKLQDRERRKAEFKKEWDAMQGKRDKDKDRGPEMG